MSLEADVVRLLAKAPLRTVRTRDLAAVYAHPRQRVRALEARGIVHRLAHGFYCAVPAEHDPATWRPSIEAAAAGIASAIFGDRIPVLTGLTAARVHRALPRAVAVAQVAVPRWRRPMHLADRVGEVRFVARRVGDLDAVLVQTDLGPALATTTEQTVLDLARSDPRGIDVDVQESIRTLLAGADATQLETLARAQRMGATLRRLEAGGPS